MKFLITRGEAYYGHALAECFDCNSAGKRLATENDGTGVDIMDVSRVAAVIEIARRHKQENKHYDVRVYEFQRGEGQTQQEDHEV